MKLTLMRDNGETTTMRTLDINTQIETMKHETKARPISNLRTSIRHASPDCKLEEAQKLTKVIPAANFRKTTNGTQMTAYNGIVQIEVNHLANRTEVNRVKQEAAELTQTLAAFMGSSGHSVKIWLRFTRPDKSLPKSREEAEIFQAHAYRKAVGLCQPALSYAIELKKPTLDQFCRQTYDPELYYNPDSTVIYMRQPLEMPSDTTYKETVQAENSPFKRLIPGYDSFDTLSALFEVALNKAYHSLSELHPNVHLHSDDDLKPLLVQLAENCFQSGIPEEETARLGHCTLLHPKEGIPDPPNRTKCIPERQRFRKKVPLISRTGTGTPDRRIYATPIRVSLQHDDNRHRISRTKHVLFLLPSGHQPHAQQHRHERTTRRTQPLGQGCCPLSGLRPYSGFQPYRRFPFRRGYPLGRSRPHPRACFPVFLATISTGLICFIAGS